MATTPELITSLYVSMFNRAPDQEGLNDWLGEAEASGLSDSELMDQIAAGFAQHPAFAAIYGDDDNAAFVDALYINIGGNAGDDSGKQFWVDKLDAGESRSDIVAEFTFGVLNADLTEDTFSDNLSPEELAAAQLRQDQLQNRVDVSQFYVMQMGAQSNLTIPPTDPMDLDSLRQDLGYLSSIAIINGVGADATVRDERLDFLATNPTPTQIIQEFDPSIMPEPGPGPTPQPGDTFVLTDGRDVIGPDSSNLEDGARPSNDDDTFIGDVGQNQNGAVANALSTGDRLDGGGGTNQIIATMINDNQTANGENLYPRPITDNIQNVFVEALESGPLNSGTIVEPVTRDNVTLSVDVDNGVVLDTGSMNNVSQFWSDNSREDMTFMDVRLGDAQSITKDIIFGLRDVNTDAGLVAAFDTNSLRAAPDSNINSQLLVRIADVTTQTPGTPLTNVSLDLGFSLNGVPFELLDIRSTNGTYDGMRIAIESALDDLGLENLQVTRTNPYTTVTVGGNTVNLPFVAEELLIRDPGGQVFTDVTFDFNQLGPVPDEFLVAGTASPQDPTMATNLIETNVVLDNAGRGSTADDVVIGGMSNSDRAIEKLNLIVDRDSKVDVVTSGVDLADSDSDSDSGNASTVAFGEIEVTSGANEGNLSINNILDTRTFDASAFAGETLSVAGQAGTNEALYTYTTPDSQDSITFSYNVDALDATTTGLNIATAGGNDVVTVDTTSGTVSQFRNHVELENVNVQTGSGEDTVNVGDHQSFANVMTGTGEDYIQVSDSTANNTAQWVFNAFDSAASGVVGRGNNDYNAFEISLQVEFQDILSEVVKVDYSDFVTTSRDINEAITQAIRNDSALNELLSVSEIKNEGLQIDSDIHRNLTPDALEVHFLAPTYAPDNVHNQSTPFVNDSADLFAARSTISDSQLEQAFATYFPDTNGLPNGSNSGTGIYAGDTTAAQMYNSLFRAVDYSTNNMADPGFADQYLSEQTEAGANSTEDTFNVIDAGTGDDVIVLSSKVGGGFDTVVFEGVFGTDTIMNFNTGNTAGVADQLNFLSYLDPIAAARGASATAINDDRVDQQVGYTFINGGPLGNSLDHNANVLVGLDNVFADLGTASSRPTSFYDINAGMIERALSANQAWVNEPSVGTGTDTSGEEMVGSTFVFRVARNQQIETNATGEGILGDSVPALTERVFTVQISGYNNTTDNYSFSAVEQGTIEYGDMFSTLTNQTAASITGTQEAKDSASDAIAALSDDPADVPVFSVQEAEEAITSGEAPAIWTIRDTADNLVPAIGNPVITGAETVQLDGAASVSQADALLPLVNFDENYNLLDSWAEFSDADNADTVNGASALTLTDDEGTVFTGVLTPEEEAIIARITNADEYVWTNEPAPGPEGIQVDQAGIENSLGESYMAVDDEEDVFIIDISGSPADEVFGPGFDGAAEITGFNSAEDTLIFNDVGNSGISIGDILAAEGFNVNQNVFENQLDYLFNTDPDGNEATIEVSGVGAQSADFIEVA